MLSSHSPNNPGGWTNTTVTSKEKHRKIHFSATGGVIVYPTEWPRQWWDHLNWPERCYLHNLIGDNRPIGRWSTMSVDPRSSGLTSAKVLARIECHVKKWGKITSVSKIRHIPVLMIERKTRASLINEVKPVKAFFDHNFNLYSI